MIDEKGSASVELALTLPVTLLVVFGLIQLALLLNAKTVLEHAAHEGMRTAVVKGDHQAVAGRVGRVGSAIPRGSGFLDGKPKVKVSRRGGRVFVTVTGRVSLLPFFRQAAGAGFGKETVKISGRSVGRVEPYLGLP